MEEKGSMETEILLFLYVFKNLCKFTNVKMLFLKPVNFKVNFVLLCCIFVFLLFMLKFSYM